MLNCSPLIPLFLGVILAIVIVRDSIVKRKFLKYRLSVSFVFIFAMALLAVFYQDLTATSLGSQILNYAMLACSILAGLAFLFNGLTNIAKNELNDYVLKSLDNNTYFLFVSKKGKIYGMSKILKDLFGIEEEVIGKNINFILDNYITINKINEEKTDNLAFKNYLKLELDKEMVNDLDLEFYKADGTLRRVKLVETPIYLKDKYHARLYVGQTNTLIVTSNAETETDEALNARFTALLESVPEGVIFKDLGAKKVWVNDYLLTKLNLPSNSLELADYEKLMDKDDRNYYLNVIEGLNNDKAQFSEVYRMSNGTKMVYVKEEGKAIFDGNKLTEIAAYVVVKESRNFIRTNTILDNLSGEAELISYINNLSNNKENYEVVYFRMLNIPTINEEYGRELGTLAMEEYVRTFKEVFSDVDAFYRISGLDFVFVISDIRKMEALKKTLTKGKIFNPSLTYGAINCTLDVVMGLSFSNDAIRPKDIYNNTKVALAKALERNQPYLFYKDINR